MAPATTMTIDNTVAKIGRSMKKWDKFMQPSSSPACLWLGRGRFWHWQDLIPGDRLRLGIDLTACPYPLHAVDDHPILRLQPIENHPQTVDNRPQFDPTILRSVLVIDHEGEALCLITADCRIWDHHRAVLAAARQTDAREEAGRKGQTWVRDDRSRGHRAGVRVEPIVDEIEVTLTGKSRFIRQPEIDGDVHLM